MFPANFHCTLRSPPGVLKMRLFISYLEPSPGSGQGVPPNPEMFSPEERQCPFNVRHEPHECSVNNPKNSVAMKLTNVQLVREGSTELSGSFVRLRSCEMLGTRTFFRAENFLSRKATFSSLGADTSLFWRATAEDGGRAGLVPGLEEDLCSELWGIPNTVRPRVCSGYD